MNRRSFGYKSFISCEDPRGVAESGTIRKPKSALTQRVEHGKRGESDRRRRNKNVGGEGQMGTGGVGGARNAFQLLEVSREARKLSHVVSSWSAGHSRNSSSDVAQDLLKGALDLGESLAVLTRLQRSSTYVSSRGSCEDTEKVILDGSHALSEEDAWNAPCSSSSRSSVVRSSKFVPPKAANKKTRRSNLIAKLMGLEDASVRSLSYSHSRPAVDHDPQHLRWKRRPTLDEMIEAVKFKGQKWDDCDSDSDDRPPIVILRPFKFSCLDLDQPIEPKPRVDLFEEMILGMRIRTNPLAQAEECEAISYNAEFGKAVQETRAKVKASSQEAQKVSNRRRKGDMKGTTKSINRLKTSGENSDYSMKGGILPSDTDKHGRRGTKNCSNSENIWPDKIHKLVNKIAPVVYADQRYRDQCHEVEINSGTESQDASQIEITVADYDDYDQSSPSETPLLFGNYMNRKSANGKGSRSPIIDNEPTEGENDLYSVCDQHANDNLSPSCSQSGSTRHMQEEETFSYMNYALSTENLKALLLRDQSFIKRAGELFDLRVNSETCLLQQADHGVGCNDFSLRVLLDAANELMGLHGLRCSRECLPHPWISHRTSSITRYSSSSLEHLLDGVCDELEALRCNTKDEGDEQSASGLLSLVKMDLRSTGMVGGMWDAGWPSAGSADEIEKITRGIGELILDGLTEEILTDLSLSQHNIFLV